MMNIKNTKLFFVILCATQIARAQLQNQPSVIISSNAATTDYVKLVNVMNNSAAYSIVTSKILNGSGNEAPTKVPVLKPVAMAMDQLSYFDLYFQKNFKQSGINNVNLEMHLLPYENVIRNFQTTSSKQIETTVNGLADAVGEFAKANIKIQSRQELYSQSNLNNIRASQLSAIRERYPVVANPPAVAGEQLQWLVGSYMPLSVSSQADISASAKNLKMTFVLPAIGFPKMLKENINGATRNEPGMVPLHFSSKGTAGTIKMDPIRSGAATFTDVTFKPNAARRAQLSAAEQTLFDQMNTSRAMRIELFKNLNQPHLMDMALSFGYLTRQNPKSVYEMNVDLPSSQEHARSLVKNSDFSMVIKGDVRLTNAVIPNAQVLEAVNKILDMHEIRLVFHKVHLTLNRLPILDPAVRFVERSPANLDLFMNNDVGFDLRNINYVPEKSVINVVVSLNPQKAQAIKDAKIIDLTAGLRANAEANAKKIALASFCLTSGVISAADRIADANLTDCQVSFSSIEDFKSNFVGKLINNEAMRLLSGELVSSTNYQAAQTSKLIDKTVEQIISAIVTDMQKAKNYATQRLMAGQ